jgi:IclR family transcriptional regulator, acetate operon repressor
MNSPRDAVAGDNAVRGTRAVDRACALVGMVVRADDPMTFAELSDESGLARSTTSRLLAALERTDLLQRDDNGGYAAGALFALYAARHDRWQEVARVGRPYLERLRDRSGETAHLGVPEGSSVIHVGQADSAYLLTPRDWTETEVPPHCSSLGKVLYAHGCLPMPGEPLERRTVHTVPDLTALEHDLAVVRRRGYAVTVDELEVGLTALAAPVRGPDGIVIAALGVSGPSARLQDRVGQVGRLLVEQADGLSALLRRRAHKEGAA